MTPPPQGDVEGPHLRLPHNTASSEVSYAAASPSALVAHLNSEAKITKDPGWAVRQSGTAANTRYRDARQRIR